MERPANERDQTSAHGNQRWGDRMRGGAVTGGPSGHLVWLNCTRLGVGVTARITPDQAEQLATELAAWARQARDNRNR